MNDFGWRSEVVCAEIVDVAPHLAHVGTFAVHRNVIDPHLSTWRCSNVETGFCIRAADADSRDACIRNAREYLADKTVKRLEKAYASAVLAGCLQ